MYRYPLVVLNLYRDWGDTRDRGELSEDRGDAIVSLDVQREYAM